MNKFATQLDLVKRLRDQGFRVVQTSKCHFKVYSPNGRDMTVIGGTPSDHRSTRNQMSVLKRMGYRESR